MTRPFLHWKNAREVNELLCFWYSIKRRTFKKRIEILWIFVMFALVLIQDVYCSPISKREMPKWVPFLSSYILSLLHQIHFVHRSLFLSNGKKNRFEDNWEIWMTSWIVWALIDYSIDSVQSKWRQLLNDSFVRFIKNPHHPTRDCELQSQVFFFSFFFFWWKTFQTKHAWTLSKWILRCYYQNDIVFLTYTSERAAENKWTKNSTSFL